MNYELCHYSLCVDWQMQGKSISRTCVMCIYEYYWKYTIYIFKLEIYQIYSVSEIHEKRIDSTISFYEPNLKQQDNNDDLLDYTTDYLDDIGEDYKIFPNSDKDAHITNTPKEIQENPVVYDTLEQTPYVKSQGAYYRGRLGLPSPVFNVHTRRIQPGPRFRNEMMRPKHFSGPGEKF